MIEKTTINHALKIAVAGGKGGVGKTTVSLAFTKALSQVGYHAQLLDCDVENPNCHLYLDLTETHTTDVTIAVPEYHSELCTHCGRCADICQYNALADIKTDLLIFDELCHGCGGCIYGCPVDALTTREAVTGQLITGKTEFGPFAYGLLKIGSARTTSVISAVINCADTHQLTIIDAAPGTGCASVTGIQNADAVVLVTEPTPFGLHDLDLTVTLMARMKKPFGVIINRVEDESNSVSRYCQERDIPVLMQIPFSRDVARACAEGKGILDVLPEQSDLFRNALIEVQELIS